MIIFIFTTFILSGCGIFSSDNEQLPFDLKPEALCTNSTAGEWTSLGLREETVQSILVHPQNPQVIFAGTGFDFSAQRDGKIFRSTDCGKNWEKVYEGGSFRGLLLHPRDPFTLFAWHHRPTGGLLRSTDGGDSWELHTNGMHTDGNNLTSVVLIRPDNPRIMYASTSAFGSGNLYKSTNGGARWENITMNHWPHLASGATAMFMHPHQPDLMLHSANMNETLSRTEDGGKTWDDVFVAEGLVSAYAMNPVNPDQIVAASSQQVLIISEDRGKNWRVEAIPEYQENLSGLVRMYDISFVKKFLYLSVDSGVYRTDDFKTYTLINNGIDFGYSETGYPLTSARTVVSDLREQNLYVGLHILRPEGGGLYVKKLE